MTVDAALASGRSRNGPQLRKRQADVHVQAVTTHVRVGRMDAAHAFFEEALKYDTDHHEAHEQLARLSGAAVP